ncbi:uncharacterized protein TNCV_4552701 [Trichonephila clavipes]|nr:uncharacterized protein TNCV_4552701 [Trichonephila clavipes]
MNMKILKSKGPTWVISQDGHRPDEPGPRSYLSSTQKNTFLQERRTMCASCDEAHFWLNGYVNKQNCRIWREANPQVYVETPLHPEKLTVWCALWAGGILLQKR